MFRQPSVAFLLYSGTTYFFCLLARSYAKQTVPYVVWPVSPLHDSRSALFCSDSFGFFIHLTFLLNSLSIILAPSQLTITDLWSTVIISYSHEYTSGYDDLNLFLELLESYFKRSVTIMQVLL